MPYPREYCSMHGEWVDITGVCGQVAVTDAPNYALRYPNAPADFQPPKHSGVDGAHPTNPTCLIYAIEDGVVVETSEDDGTQNGHFLWGLTAGIAAAIRVDAIRQNEVVYAQEHFSERFVRVGERVTRGQPIGRQGSTGISTGPHCHGKLFVNSQLRDIFPFCVGDPDSLLRIKDVFADPIPEPPPQEDTDMVTIPTTLYEYIDTPANVRAEPSTSAARVGKMIATGDQLWVNALAGADGYTWGRIDAGWVAIAQGATAWAVPVGAPDQTAEIEALQAELAQRTQERDAAVGERDYKQHQLEQIKEIIG